MRELRHGAKALATACVLGFVVLYAAAFAAPGGRAVDARLYTRVSHAGLEPVRAVSARTLDTIDAVSVLLVGGALVAVALARGRRRRALVTAAAVLAPIATAEVLKPLLAPLDRRLAPGRGRILDASFPSGHATVAMALALAVVLVAPRAIRIVVAVLGAAYAAAVGIAVVALGWHYPSDVLGGFLVAAGWAAAAVVVLRRWGEQPESARTARRRERLGIVAGAVLTAAFVVFVAVALATHPEFTAALRLRRSLLGTTGALSAASAVLVGATVLLAREPVRSRMR